MQVLEKRGLHPAIGLSKAPAENSRAVLRLHEWGQQRAWSGGSFMNVSVGKMVGVETAPVACWNRWCGRCCARQRLAFTSLCRTTEMQYPPHYGDPFPNFPQCTVERRASPPSWTKLLFFWLAIGLSERHCPGLGMGYRAHEEVASQQHFTQ